MKQNFWSGIAALAGALLLAGAALAEISAHDEMKVVVMADGDEIIDADISDLAVGESRSYVTQTGKNVDIVRTAEGVDLFIDGELQDLDVDFDGLHGEHRVLHQDTEIECSSDSGSDCTHEFVFVSSDDDYAYETGGGDNVVVIRKAIEIVCDEGDDCSSLHEDEQAHKVIRIKRKALIED